MADTLNGMRVAILATDRFEEAELLEPMQALEAAGAKPEVVSPKAGEIQAVIHDEQLGQRVKVDRTLAEARPNEYEALVLPGGVANPDRLRIIPEAVAFVRAFFEEGKPVAAICHGPWTIIEADQARGHEMTSWPSLKTDLRNAGANWVDREVVVDRNLVTSRKPDDLPAFNAKMIEAFAKRGKRRAAAE
jgi:protease I